MQRAKRDTLLQFVVAYWRPHLRIILLAAVTMLCATVLSLMVPIMAKEVATYDGGTMTTRNGHLQKVDSPQDDDTTSPASTVQRDAAASVTANAGRFSEWLFGGYVLTHTCGRGTFLYGLVCRALLMALVVMLYHVVSLIAHLSAYRAGMATQASMIESSLVRVLRSRYPERIAVVNPVKLTQIITASAKTCGDTLGAVLTDVLSSIFSVLGLVTALLYISTPLTVVIGVLVCLVQYVYFLAGRNQQSKGAAVANEESSVQASLCNALQRSETIFVFGCHSFVVERLREKLTLVKDMADELNLCIHGYAAVSSGATTLIFVIVLGMSNYYHRRGDIALMDIALYFMFLQQFVSRLMQLSKDISQSRATIGRLRTLKQMLEWYEEGDACHGKEQEDFYRNKSGSEEGGESCRALEASNIYSAAGEDITVADTTRRTGAEHGRVILDTMGTASIGLEHVSFQYPRVPAFFSEDANHEGKDVADTVCSGATAVHVTEEDCWDDAQGGEASQQQQRRKAPPAPLKRGIRDISFTVQPRTITTLYAPSGYGKSTCLRLLSGLVKPQVGTVRTQQRVALLEQQHAIFIGTVAENILLMDLGASGVLRSDSSPASLGASRFPWPWHRRGSKQAGTRMHLKSNRRRDSSPTLAKAQVSPVLQEQVKMAAERSGCASFLTDPFYSLIENVDHPPFSGGQLQRICLARIFSGNHPCSLVLLDEPTTGLDDISVTQLLETIKELRDVHRKTVIISTHDHRVAEIADNVVNLGK